MESLFASDMGRLWNAGRLTNLTRKRPNFPSSATRLQLRDHGFDFIELSV
jgi:hypothetical protein